MSIRSRGDDGPDGPGTGDRTPVVAIVGGGFSGLLCALHVLRARADIQVRLFERSAQFGRGRAFLSDSQDALLNVRAGNMSAFPDRPSHFQDWLAEQAKGEDAQGFVSRARYGDYLQAQLRGALARAGSNRLLLEADEVVAAGPAADGGWTLTSWMGREFAADAVVLAVGLLPPQPLPRASDRLLRARGVYFGDPWSARPDDAEPGDVLLVGSGLTMVDVALGLARGERRLLALSRRGLVPHSHAPAAFAPMPAGELGAPREALRSLRAHAREVGWREAVDSIRPLTQAVWRSWPVAERRRFLRHLRPWWDVHRHRMAPAVAAQIAVLSAKGSLTVAAGEILELDLGEGGSAVLRYRPRGGRATLEREFAAVVNCTGPHGDLSVAGSRLLETLGAGGFVRGDALRLGLDVDEQCQAIGADGRPTAGLFVAGPLTRGAVWESVAVPDLRNQAAEVARRVADHLARNKL